MAIIGFQYTGPAQKDDQIDYYTYLTNPTYTSSRTSTYTSFSESFYFKKFKGNTEPYSQPYNPVVGIFPTISDDFWVRIFHKKTDGNFGKQGEVILSLKTKVGNIYYTSAILQVGLSSTNNANLYWLTYNSVGVVTSTTTIGTLTSTLLDTTNKNFVLDLRIKLHPVAGYIQVYDYTTTVKFEVLGKTIESNIIPTHYALCTTTAFSSAGTDAPLFSILADEKTFGMYVAPLLVKGEGSYQEQDAGYSYTNLLERKNSPTDNGYLGVTVSTGQSKTYTAKLNNMSDIALPSNYIIKSLKISEIFEATQTQPTPVNVALKLKYDANEYSYPVNSIVPNTNGSTDNNWQVRSVTLNNNPATSAQWQTTDLTNLEVGFTVTGV